MHHAGLFPEFAHYRIVRILVGVDAALRHLPFKAWKNDLRSVAAKAPPDQHVAGSVEQRDPDIGTIGFAVDHRELIAAREFRKLLHHALIDRALERNDQVGEILHRLPARADEFRLVAAAGAGNIYLGVLAGETNRKPFLPLATIAALPGAPGHGAWNVVDQPIRDLAEFLDRADAGLLIQFALRGSPGILTGIDAALRHLPDVRLIDMFDAAGAATDEDQPGCVDQHHADACSIGQVFVARHSVKASYGPYGRAAADP